LTFLAACSSNSGHPLDDGGPSGDGKHPDAKLVDAGGGSISELRFAIVGDTRPPSPDDTANYPTPIITKIWQDIENESPRPEFAVSTGDYMFASTFRSEQIPQL